ncbi:ferritin-like domain-containing protein [Gilvimarinus sp. F26214L]|uniref:ferritin-like domain-containing protein n=1 Tax=Gilvimarinus sp. DZF01 TaxID=3461371 RepID=UPI004045ABD7
MEKSETIGANRTGVDTSPILSKAMQKGMDQYAPTAGRREDLDSMRRAQLREAERIGSVPLPGTTKGLLKSLMEKFTGHQPATFVNKLGERLAYERSGTRVYEAMLLKCQVAEEQGEMPVRIPLDRMRQFHDEEGQHFQLLVDCMNKLGVDPTAQTPDADVSGVASMGLMKVITDARTTIPQCLEAMLSLELTDNAGWELLMQLAEDLGQSEMAEQFQKALAQEQVHLEEIRSWYEQSVRQQASGMTH